MHYVPLIDLETVHGDFVTSVAINHEHMDSLIGRLMQMCDLTGDLEQRKALKDTIKQICREWLNSEYEICRYDRWAGAAPGTRTVEAKRYQIEMAQTN